MTSALAGVEITDASALVTGANRGLGKAFVRELLDRGARRVYAGARNLDTVDFKDNRVIPIRLDSPVPTMSAPPFRRCGDVAVVINNAGAMLRSPLLAAADLQCGAQ